MNQKLTAAAMAQGHTRSGSDNLVLPYTKKLPEFLRALPAAAMPSHNSQAGETTHSHPVELTTQPACPQVHADENISVSHLESAIQTKAARELASPSHITETRKSRHIINVT